MDKGKFELLEAVDVGDGIVVVALTRNHVRPEALPDTRQFLVNAVSVAGGHRTLVVDVSALDCKDMLLGLKYRDGLTNRTALNAVHIHNVSADENPTIVKEFLYIHKILGFLGKAIIVAGIDKETRQMMHKARLDRKLNCKDTVEQAVQEIHAPMPGDDHWHGASDAGN